LIGKEMTENTNNNEKYSLDDLTHKIIYCANEVHKRVGDGFHELVYKRPLALEFFFQNLSYEKELQMPLSDEKQFETNSIDFIVEGKIMVEVKSILQIGNEQLENSLYNLKSNNLDIGLLINFGSEFLEVKKIINTSKV
jgi:GxxExxY protein